MAQKTEVILIDDLDGGQAEETVEFGLDGKTYAIDLSAENAAKLREALDPFVRVARKIAVTPHRRAVRVSTGVDATAVREWAKANGIAISSRGRIPKDAIEKYVAAGN